MSKDHCFLSSRKLWKCKECSKQFTVKVKTITEDSHLGLDKWLCAIWMLANSKNGIGSYEVQRSLGVTQKSAWFMLHRLRHAMYKGNMEKFSGEIETDKTAIGGLEKN